MGRTEILVAIVVLMTLGLLGVAFTQEALGPTRDPVAGARLFASKGCVTCHAVNGAGGTDGPDLGRMARPLLLYDVAARMWNHVPQMARRITALQVNRPYLNADELSDLMAFLGTVDPSGRPGSVSGRFAGDRGAGGSPARRAGRRGEGLPPVPRARRRGRHG